VRARARYVILLCTRTQFIVVLVGRCMKRPVNISAFRGRSFPLFGAFALPRAERASPLIPESRGHRRSGDPGARCRQIKVKSQTRAASFHPNLLAVSRARARARRVERYSAVCVSAMDHSLRREIPVRSGARFGEVVCDSRRRQHPAEAPARARPSLPRIILPPHYGGAFDRRRTLAPWLG